MTDACGRVASFAFAGVSALKGSHWLLLPDERETVGAALATSFDSFSDDMASEMAEKAMKISAPLAVLEALGTVIMTRVAYEQSPEYQQLQMEKRRQAEAKRRQKQERNVQTPRTPASQPQNVTSTSGGAGHTEPLYNRTPDGYAFNPEPTSA